jgi:hypothetical protein
MADVKIKLVFGMDDFFHHAMALLSFPGGIGFLTIKLKNLPIHRI